MKSYIPEKAVHGGKVKELREKGDLRLLDFSASMNPFPPSVDWVPDLSRLSDYPDDDYRGLKEKIAALSGRKKEEICIGNGSVEIMRSFCHALVEKGDTVVIRPPTFGEYALSVAIAGGRAVSEDPRAVAEFLCNPNNPDGRLLKRQQVLGALERCAAEDRILFVDEAFIGLADPNESVIGHRSPHLFVLRSLTKSFSVPGLRIGFGVGDPDLVAAVEAVRPPWTLNAFAEDFALLALDHCADLETSRRMIREERQWIEGRLAAIGIRFRPSSANYLLLDLDRDAAEVAASLRSRGVLVRDGTSFGLPRSIRVAVRRREENQVLMEALERCVR